MSRNDGQAKAEEHIKKFTEIFERAKLEQTTKKGQKSK